MRLALLLGLLLAFNPLCAQNSTGSNDTTRVFSDSKVNLIDIVALAADPRDASTRIIVSNCEVTLMSQQESENLRSIIAPPDGNSLVTNQAGKLVINKSIILDRCRITEGSNARLIQFADVEFKRPLHFSLATGRDVRIAFRNCDIHSLFIGGPVHLEFLLIARSQVNDQVKVTVDKIDDVEFLHNRFGAIPRNPEDYSKLYFTPELVTYLRSRGYRIFTPNMDTVMYGRRNLMLPRLYVQSAETSFFGFVDNIVEHDSLHRMSFYLGKVQRLIVTRNEINTNLLLNGTQVDTQLDLTANRLGKDNSICFSDFGFPENDCKVYWEDIGNNRLGYMENLMRRTGDLDGFFAILYKGVRDDELANVGSYRQLMKGYGQLLSVFRQNSDLESQNSCYSEMKELEGRRLGYVYRTEGGFQNYFRWMLNRLMKYYTNHGTDPAEAIVASVWIVFLFGVFYFFFPSDWDVTSKAKLIANFRDFIEENEKGYVKPFLALVAGVLVSMLNAIVLSLNAFTTLGFGNIPTVGVARYVCVIEGFIGWFLLSIFTVALINQTLY